MGGKETILLANSNRLLLFWNGGQSLDARLNGIRHERRASEDIRASGWCEDGFDALQLWKILEQDARLPSCGYAVRNVNGLANLYGFMHAHAMAIVPDEVRPGSFELATNFVANRGGMKATWPAHGALCY
jgi:hypothetical protein